MAAHRPVRMMRTASAQSMVVADPITKEDK